MGGYSASDWTSPELLALAESAEAVADKLPNGSTEAGLIREALRKIELADTYVEQRVRDERNDNAEDQEEREREEMRLELREDD